MYTFEAIEHCEMEFCSEWLYYTEWCQNDKCLLVFVFFLWMVMQKQWSEKWFKIK